MVGLISFQSIPEPEWIGLIIAGFSTLLAIPVVNSAIIGVIQRAGVSPRLLAYLTATVLGLAVLVVDLPVLPTFDPETPEAFVAAWGLLAVAFFALTESLYQRILRNWPLFNPGVTA